MLFAPMKGLGRASEAKLGTYRVHSRSRTVPIRYAFLRPRRSGTLRNQSMPSTSI